MKYATSYEASLTAGVASGVALGDDRGGLTGSNGSSSGTRSQPAVSVRLHNLSGESERGSDQTGEYVYVMYLQSLLFLSNCPVDSIPIISYHIIITILNLTLGKSPVKDPSAA